MVLSKTTVSAKKGHVTRAVNECKAVTSQDEVDKIKLDLALQSLKIKFKNYQQVFDQYETEQLEGKTLEQFAAEIKDHSKYENDVVEQISNFEHTLEEEKGDIKTTKKQNQAPKAKLPELKLGSFSGNILQWVPFWDSYKSLIDDRSDLDDVEKMTYLKSCLTGPAEELISGYQISRASYADAIKALKDKYDDKDKIKQHLCHLLLDLKPPSYNLAELTSYLNEYQSIIRNLKQYVNNVETANWLLVEMLLRKLPAQVETLLFTKLHKHYFTIEEVEQGIRDSIQHLTKTKEKQNLQGARNSKETNYKPTNQTSSSKFQGKMLTASNKPKQENAIGTYQVGSKGQKSKYACLFCQEQHPSSECEKYVTLKDKKDRLKELDRCARCISNRHEETQCDAILLMCRKCGKGKHHTALCLKRNAIKTNVTENPQVVAQQSILSVKTDAYKKSTALPTATVEVWNQGNNKKITRAFFDQGFQCTFICKNISSQLNLKVHGKVKLALSGFLKSKDYDEYEVVKPTIRLGNRFKRIEAVVLDNLPNNIFVPGLIQTATMLKNVGIHLADKYLCSDKVEGIELIIGADYYGEFITGVTVENQINLARSSAGYLIYGKIPHTNTEESNIQTVIVARMGTEVAPTEITDLIEENTIPVQKLWELDAIGIDVSKPTPEDNITYQTYLDSVKYEGGKYWVQLPWKVDCPVLPTNYSMALGQLRSLTKSLKIQNNLKTYHKLIISQENNDFIERVEKASIHDRTHYLPHHAVKKDSETTPLRIVFNCSAKRNKNPSLNDCLMKGPSLTEKLGNILIKFRLGKYAYSADISKAFLRVGLQKCDRDFTRFLWYEDPEDETSPIVTYRFKSVLFGATCSPFLLLATLDTHLRSSNNKYKELLRNHFYVDNFLGTTNDEDELIDIYHNANTELLKADMPLRMWASNNSALNQMIEQDFIDYRVPDCISVLGLQWDIRNDTLSIRPPTLVDYSSLSKRILLSLVSSLFDPLGLVTPITIRGKLLLREAWKQNTGWDEELPASFPEDWRKLEEDYKRISEIEIPRMIVSEDIPCQIHIFCDASSLAYGAVAYYVCRGSQLITSKARVAPIKTRSLPQLELTALQVGTHLAKYIHDTSNLKISRTVMWSDSEASLQWIKNDQSKIPYVKNRVADIRGMASDYEFKHVSGKENPADLLSRGVSLSNFMGNEIWRSGPSWLTRPSHWPMQKEEVTSVFTTISSYNPVTSYLFDASKISSLSKIMRITDYIFKFLKLLKPSLKLPSSMTYWTKVIQREHYNEEFEQILANKRNSSSSLVKNLGLFLEPSTNLIHCRGRLHHSDLNIQSKYPILLPRHSWLTTLLIRIFHEQALHGGTAETLAIIREKYWIPKGRQVVKTVLKECLICKIIESKPYKLPGPPPLPRERVNLNEPFQTVGVDYSGPITITKCEDGMPKKFYICLFTCATTRAVHLELARDLSATTFLHILRRFIARRSAPRILISDNASNFTATSKFLKELYRDPLVNQHLLTKGLEWKFIAPGAPWKGGFYERLIGVVKNCIRKVLFKRKISEEELITVLAEVEMRVNNRPLTYIDDDINNPVPLTPSHLLHGKRLNPMPINHDDLDTTNDPDYIGPSELNNRYKYLSTILKHWEKVWRRDYLTSLRERHYGGDAVKQRQEIKVGDVVLVQNEGPRVSWHIGKITKLYPDEFGTIRIVDVTSKGSVSKKTIEKLVPLELHCQTSEPESKPEENSSRPKRQAAEKAKDAIQKIINANLYIV